MGKNEIENVFRPREEQRMLEVNQQEYQWDPAEGSTNDHTNPPNPGK
jgi:hypothetical protein